MPKKTRKRAGRNKDGTFKKGHKLSRTSRNRKSPKRKSNAKKPARKKKRRNTASSNRVSRTIEATGQREQQQQATGGPDLYEPLLAERAVANVRDAIVDSAIVAAGNRIVDEAALAFAQPDPVASVRDRLEAAVSNQLRRFFRVGIIHTET